MPVDEEVLTAAHALDRHAIETLLESVYPAVHRIAHALTGREDVARGVIRFVMNQSLPRIRGWLDADAPDRWFHHHTVLTARRSVHQPTPQNDILVTNAGQTDPPYLAFVRALRSLPVQQREAFILHHGEKLAMRQLGIAMDCSMKAAEQHLQSATQALRAIAGPQFEPLTQLLAHAYAKTAPADELVRPAIREYVNKAVRPRYSRLLIRIALLILAILAVLWLLGQLGSSFNWQGIQQSPISRPP